MSNPYIHWTEECNYCYKRGICEYEDDTRDFRKALSMLHNGAKYVFGTINFKCDYFKLDENKFRRNYMGECSNGVNP